MSRQILLGIPGTKRTVYLTKETQKAGVEMEVADWKEFPRNLEKIGCLDETIFLKIDPPQWDSCYLEELGRLVSDYEKNLEQLEDFGSNARAKISFLNEPGSIKALLDKKTCKRQLKKAGIPVTEEMETGETMESNQEGTQRYPLAEKMLEVMEQKKVFQVFLKPNYGSGAAGVMALRYEPGRGRLALYTCVAEEPVTGRLVNTRRLRRFTDRERVLSMADRLLQLDCIIERWYAKAEHEGYSYDLRAVVQDGQMDFALARLSPGPITNLQLNNHPLKAEELGLSQKVWDSVTCLCREASGCFPGLRSVGIDILLEKGSLRPRIIEMNGQGDLIYQDIYGENRIYRQQAQMMGEWMTQKTADGGERDERIRNPEKGRNHG